MAKKSRAGSMRYKRPGRYVQLHDQIAKHQAFTTMTCEAQMLLIHLMRRAYPEINGDVGFSIGEASKLLRCSANTARKAIQQLVVREFIICTKGHNITSLRAREWFVTTVGTPSKPIPPDNWQYWKDKTDGTIKS